MRVAITVTPVANRPIVPRNSVSCDAEGAPGRGRWPARRSAVEAARVPSLPPGSLLLTFSSIISLAPASSDISILSAQYCCCGICGLACTRPDRRRGACTGPPPAPRRAFLALARRGPGPRARCWSGRPRGAAPTGAPDRRCLSGPGGSCRVRAARALGHRAVRRPN